MTKIDEIIIKHDPYERIKYFDRRIILMMKEYAEFYAQKCLEIAAENADIHPMRAYNQVDKRTILDIKKPNHDDL